MYRKYALLTLLLCKSIFSQTPVKDIHNAFSLHPVAINDYYINPQTTTSENVRPAQPPSKQNIEDTVKEVQELIKSNPKLPRLTRGEIIDIIENITKTDANALNTREEGKRALMVVMPFTAGSAQGEDIKELYTRTPVTHMIDGHPLPPVKKVQKKNRRRPTLPPPQLPEEEIENLYKVPVQVSTSTLPPTMLTKVTKYLITDSTSSSPLIFTSTKKPTTQKSIRTSTSTFIPPTIQFLPKTPQPTKLPVKYPNHRYPDDPTSSDKSQGGLRIISPPQLSPMHYDNQFVAPFTISMSKLQPMPEYVSSTSTERNLIDDIPIPEDYKNVVKDLNLLINTNDSPYQKPLVQKLTTVKEATTSQRTYPTSTSMPDISNVADSLSPEMKDLLVNFGLIEDPNKKPVPVVSTENVPYKQNADINPESYLTFKPLPDSVPSRSEMEEFLARFGLGRSTFRSQKSIATNTQSKETGKDAIINFDVVPDNMKHIIKDLGFSTNLEKIQSLNQISHQSKHVFNPSVQTANEQELEKLSKLLDMIKELEKYNGNMTEENLKNIDVNTLRELIGDFNGNKFVPLNEQDAPNPLSEGILNSESKNGVKRQENSTTTSTTTPIPTTIELATEKTDSPSLIDLEASFADQTDQTERVAVTTTTEPTTTTPRTGFYYLFDWNTFLELDNQLGRRVNLRFQPHSGDPRQFSSVTVP
ncbi:hypothetical protein MML48_4g00021029 [Holotrichia oblita]|uniref:Uncharacterized protein n=1 Tax=Holotrichia oblita TaxID=644536 RepID=A0ACB9T7S1_HOLOL|nr:hypothetical protein MML48_4g00021029 [Holotrichia oblita]